MTSEHDNICIAKLRELERQHQAIDAFAALGSSSWVSLKNLIFERSLSHLDFSQVDRKKLFSFAAFCIVGRSLWHYFVRVVFLRPQKLFMGAGSGVFLHQGRMLDSYLPAELSSAPGIPADDTLYFLSANHVEMMWSQRDFLRDHQAIVYSFLVAPLRQLLARALLPFLKLNRRLTVAASNVSAVMINIGVDISPGDVLRFHARFCAGYLIYQVLFLPLRIRQAYVVSAYSNSEACAVLRKMGIQIIEVQHGLIGPTHRGYNYAVRNRLLPVPHKVSVYSDFWKDELIAAGYFESSEVVVGKRLKYTLAEAERFAFDFPYVVLTGQGILLDKVSAFIDDFASQDSRLHLVYVPHPNEGQDYISRIKAAAADNTRIHVLDKAVATTERLIIGSVAHVSVYSSCHFDAIHYKGKTFVLDLLEDNLMHYYTRRRPNAFIPVKDAKTLLERLGGDF